MLGCAAAGAIEQALAEGYAGVRFRGFELTVHRIGRPGASTGLDLCLRRDCVVLRYERIPILAAGPRAVDVP